MQFHPDSAHTAHRLPDSDGRLSPDGPGFPAPALPGGPAELGAGGAAVPVHGGGNLPGGGAAGDGAVFPALCPNHQPRVERRCHRLCGYSGGECSEKRHRAPAQKSLSADGAGSSGGRKLSSAVPLPGPDGSNPAGGKPAADQLPGHRRGRCPPAGGGWLRHSGQPLDVGLPLRPRPDLAALQPLFPHSSLPSVGERTLFSAGSHPDDHFGLRNRKATQL